MGGVFSSTSPVQFCRSSSRLRFERCSRLAVSQLCRDAIGSDCLLAARAMLLEGVCFAVLLVSALCFLLALKAEPYFFLR